MRLSLRVPDGRELALQLRSLFGGGWPSLDHLEHLQNILRRVRVSATQDAVEAIVFRGHPSTVVTASFFYKDSGMRRAM